MSSMVERVREAAYIAADKAECRVLNRECVRRDCNSFMCRNATDAAARAAIEAMREPSVSMLEVMRLTKNHQFVSVSLAEQQRYDMAVKWNAGIDAALEDK